MNKQELRKAAERLLNPIVTEHNGKRITMGFLPEDYNRPDANPDNCPVRVVVEDL